MPLQIDRARKSHPLDDPEGGVLGRRAHGEAIIQNVGVYAQPPTFLSKLKASLLRFWVMEAASACPSLPRITTQGNERRHLRTSADNSPLIASTPYPSLRPASG